MHGTSAALRDAAAEFGSRQTENVAQGPEQRYVAFRVNRFHAAVYSEAYH
jgi:hypothetical protein